MRLKHLIIPVALGAIALLTACGGNSTTPAASPSASSPASAAPTSAAPSATASISGGGAGGPSSGTATAPDGHGADMADGGVPEGEVGELEPNMTEATEIAARLKMDKVGEADKIASLVVKNRPYTAANYKSKIKSALTKGGISTENVNKALKVFSVA